MSKKISISGGRVQTTFGSENALRLLKKAGFDGIDFDLECYNGRGILPDIVNMPYDDFVAHFKGVKAVADEIGLEIPSVHSLLDGYVKDVAKNEWMRAKVRRDIEAASILGAKYCVIHSVSTLRWGFDADPNIMHQLNQKMYEDFTPWAEEFGVCLTLESFGGVTVNGVRGYDYFSNHKAMCYEYDSIKTDMKAFCLDSGHTNVAVGGGCLSVPDFIRYFGDRIKMLHLHDNDGMNDQHLIPGFGYINWPAVFDALDEIGYDGYYNYELVLKFGDCLEDSIMFLGKFLRMFTDKRGAI